MPAPIRRRSTAAAIALTASLTAGAALLLSACGPDDPTADGVTPTATTSAASGSGKGPASGSTPVASARPVSSGGPAKGASPVNGTAHNGLTISDGSRYVVMNGTRVDFGTPVLDLSWSPDGSRAAFIDGDGDLAVSSSNGSGRVIVAKNPGGRTWSHPSWQVHAADTQDGLPAVDNLFFSVTVSGTSKLYSVKATAHQGTPTLLGLSQEPGANEKGLPQTGNIWPNAAGSHGEAVYANSVTGDVYIRDDYLRQQGWELTAGSEPALSPGDDEDVVFVRSVQGHDHLFVEHSTDSGPAYKDITPHATVNYDEPAWSADGATIAARTVNGIVTLPADGSAAPVTVSGYHGLPAYRAS